jgi:hypothetical protein
MAQDFCLFSRRKNRRVAGYVTIFTTQEMNKKDQSVGYIHSWISPKFQPALENHD